MAERVHPLEGHLLLKKGVIKSLVRTLSGRRIVVDNEELKACARTVSVAVKGRRQARERAKAGLPPRKPRSAACCVS